MIVIVIVIVIVDVDVDVDGCCGERLLGRHARLRRTLELSRSSTITSTITPGHRCARNSCGSTPPSAPPNENKSCSLNLRSSS